MCKVFIYTNLLLVSSLFLMSGRMPFTEGKEEAVSVVSEKEPTATFRSKLYHELELNEVLDYNVFEKAMIGYDKLKAPNKDVFTIIDYSKPSTDERLFVLDIKNRRVLYSSLVSHGKRSGENYATRFSNRAGSNMSSLGFFVTENTYQGRNGYSLILEGLERGINDKVKARSVVIHGASYADPEVVEKGGRLGRSQGCPAVPQHMTIPIINTIKGGTLLFIYGNDKTYIRSSSVLSGSQRLAQK